MYLLNLVTNHHLKIHDNTAIFYVKIVKISLNLMFKMDIWTLARKIAIVSISTLIKNGQTDFLVMIIEFLCFLKVPDC